MKLTPMQESARGEVCALRIPSICNHDNSTTVLCHAPFSGKFGSRRDDWWAVYGCSSCHDAVDHRSNIPPLIQASMPNYWLDAIHETQQKMIDKGIIVVP